MEKILKRKSIVLLGLVLCCSLVGCQSVKTVKKYNVTEKQQVVADTSTQDTKEVNAETQVASNEIASEVVTDKNSSVSINYEDKSREEKDTDGNLLVTVTSNLPTVTVEGNSAATDKINAYYLEKQKAEEVLVNEYMKNAKEELKSLDAEQKANWNGYAIENKYKMLRVDDTIISIVQDGYEFMGGAHPNSYRYVQNFDSETGELLTLKDVLTDVEQGTKYINDYLLKLMKQSELSSGFFDDYESNIGDVLTDTTWYLSEEGFVVICNEGIVSPHAVGIQEYVIPYGEFTYLVDKYKKN